MVTQEIKKALSEGTFDKNELFDLGSDEFNFPITETFETIEQFIDSSKKWNEKTSVKTGTIAGFPFASWHMMQAEKGQSRESLSVIDLGDFRLVVHCGDVEKML